MNQNTALDGETELHEAEGSLRRGWPAIIVTVGVVSAALYSFTPRPPPPFPATAIQADTILANTLARNGSRLLAAGEQGRILIADDPAGPWREAVIEPQRGSTFTQLKFVDRNVAVGVGHDGWIVRSQDNGQSWTEVEFDPDSAEPLMGLAGPYDGKLFAYGAFGRLHVSTDLGVSWSREELVAAEDDDAGGELDAANDPDSEDYNPFAAFMSGGGGGSDMSGRHLNGMTRVSDGSLFVVGERGLIARSKDAGQSWTQTEEIYNGSFYGVMPIPGNGVLVYGMLGHAFYSYDNGTSWQRCAIPVEQSLFDGTVTASGDVLLAGASNTILISKDGGRSFSQVVGKTRDGIVALLPLDADRWLTAGEAGIRVQSRMQPTGDAS